LKRFQLFLTHTKSSHDRVMHKLKIEITKFTLVGAANFILTFIIFTTMLKVMSLNYLLSLLVAWVVGMCFSYALNFSWVFKPEQKIQFKDRFLKFFLASLISIALNMLLLSYFVVHADFDPFYVQMALIPLIMIFNFSTAKYWSLRASL
jgi:putative flippase GtrA